MSGYIKLYRKILEWGWYHDKNVFIVFVELLLTANYKDYIFEGKPIKRGQIVIGISKLAKSTSLTFQQTRTALDKLKSTNEITIKTTNRFSIITIVNYGLYQDCESENNNQNNNQNNKRITNKQQGDKGENQQTNNKQITSHEVNNDGAFGESKNSEIKNNNKQITNKITTSKEGDQERKKKEEKINSSPKSHLESNSSPGLAQEKIGVLKNKKKFGEEILIDDDEEDSDIIEKEELRKSLEGFHVVNMLTDNTKTKVSKYGVDLFVLTEAYARGIRDGFKDKFGNTVRREFPRNINAAFLKWCSHYVEGMQKF